MKRQSFGAAFFIVNGCHLFDTAAEKPNTNLTEA